MINALDRTFLEEESKLDLQRVNTMLLNKKKTTIRLGASDVSDRLLTDESDSRTASLGSSLSDGETTKKRRKRSKAPFLTEYGIAIENFFKLECSLIAMFAVLSALAVC